MKLFLSLRYNFTSSRLKIMFTYIVLQFTSGRELLTGEDTVFHEIALTAG